MELCITQYARAVFTYSSRRGRTLKEIHFVDIKPETVKKIADGFQSAFHQNTEPSCYLNKFVISKGFSPYESGQNKNKHKKDTSYNKNVGATGGQSKADLSGLPEPVDIPICGVTGKVFQLSFNKQLTVYPGRVQDTKREVDAVIVKVDSNGYITGSDKDLLTDLDSNMHSRSDFYRKKNTYLKKNNWSGDAFVTEGYGCGFRSIIFAVLDAENIKNKDVLNKVFTNIFKQCQINNIKAVSSSLLNTSK